jgi:hypothetical protein
MFLLPITAITSDFGEFPGYLLSILKARTTLRDRATIIFDKPL